LQSEPDRFQNSILLFCPFIVPESQDTVSALFQQSIPLSIMFRSLRVLTAIYLEDQFFRKANKIDNKASERLLTAKLVTGESFSPKLLPQLVFMRCLTFTQFACLSNVAGGFR